MGKVLGRLAAAIALWLGVHSLLASRPAKEAAVRWLGERRRNAFYRLGYNAFALLSFGALGWYAARLPDRELYRAPRPVAGLLRAGQLFSLLQMLGGARQIGLGRFSGLAGLAAWARGDAEVPDAPEAQGPAPDGTGRLQTGGPFRWSRHALNFWILPLFWLMPRMTARLLLFNALITLYAVPASRHEEARLRAAYGEEYAAYAASGTPFLIPWPPRR